MLCAGYGILGLAVQLDCISFQPVILSAEAPRSAKMLEVPRVRYSDDTITMLQDLYIPLQNSTVSHFCQIEDAMCDLRQRHQPKYIQRQEPKYRQRHKPM